MLKPKHLVKPETAEPAPNDRSAALPSTILETCLEAVINDPSMNDREKLLEMARKIVAEQS